MLIRLAITILSLEETPLKDFDRQKEYFASGLELKKMTLCSLILMPKDFLLTTTRVVLPESKNQLSNSNVKFIL
ncbi:hypothetical protein A8G17_37845 [Escherichia coli]|nr:hypothetical protein A8G17_37845 [Escherichia coli]